MKQAAGTGKRYAGLDDSAVVVAAGRWAALESWITSQKLAAIREIIRRRPAAGQEPGTAGGLPEVWCNDLDEELACELAITRNAAGDLIELAWVLEKRLPLTAAALDGGVLDLSKVRMIAAETSVLSDQDAGEAEKLVAGKWAGKTWGQLRTLVVRAVMNIDPEGAAKRRERAERDDARVRLWREHAGTAGLAGYGLQTERALMANAILQARACDYRAWGVPGTLDQLRALAYLDLLTGKDSRTQYPKTGSDPAPATTPDGTGPDATGQDGELGDCRLGEDWPGDCRLGDDEPGADEPGEAAADIDLGDGETRDMLRDDETRDDSSGDDGNRDAEPGDGPWDRESEDDGLWDDEPGDEPGDDESGGGGPDGKSGGPGGGGGRGGPGGNDRPGGGVVTDDGLPANVDLTIPLPCLTDHAQRAGEAHGLGVLDPDLARKLAAEAAKHPRSIFRVIITDPDGHAIGFGQANRIRKRRPWADEPPSPCLDNRDGIRDGTAMPRVTFTPVSIRQDTLSPDHADVPPDPAIGPDAGTGWEAAVGVGQGTWILRIGEQAFSVRLLRIPSGECDHRYESRGYQPSETLRRLVQIRDGECTMPICVRHPRGCDWEHAVPWPAGRTCCCNGGSRCRHDHMIKQSPRWNVEQLPGGLHRWTTPSGLTYTKGPKEYPI